MAPQEVCNKIQKRCFFTLQYYQAVLQRVSMAYEFHKKPEETVTFIFSKCLMVVTTVSF